MKLRLFLCAVVVLFILNNASSQTFSLQTTGLPGIYVSSSDWADYDKDGDLDLLVCGRTSTTSPYALLTKVYKNNGSNSFTDAGISLLGIEYGSAKWIDYNNDGFIDISVSGNIGTTYITKIFEQNVDGSFSEKTGLTFAGVYQGDIAWGDYNCDGFKDLLLSSRTSTDVYVTKLYKNNGDETFTEQTSVSLTGVSGTCSWIDFDGDGDLDISISGYTGSERITKIYKNNGNNTFTGSTIASIGGTAKYGDYDGDGDLDLAIAGYSATLLYVTKIYQNQSNTYVEQANVFDGAIGDCAWFDYDNDGDLDLMYVGSNGSAGKACLYKNNGVSGFAIQSTEPFVGVTYPSLNIVDYDNDNDLDVFITGNASGTLKASLFKNSTVTVRPANAYAPASILSSITSVNANLKWNYPLNGTTKIKNSSFNLFVKKIGSIGYYISPLADTVTGNLKYSALGNQQTDTFFNLKNLPIGVYRWGVQAIDGLYKGSTFNKGFFSITDTFQASKVSINDVTISWERGNGDSCVVFVHEGDASIPYPVNNTKYTANTTFGSGTQLGNGWYCVYNGPKNNASVSNIKSNTTYKALVIEYIGYANNEKYVRKNTTNYLTFTTGLFVPQNISINSQTYSSVAWGDYDNDGDVDLAYCGASNIKILKNTGGSYAEIATNIKFMYNGSMDWGDYDNDGDLDMLITGYDGTSCYSKIYNNNNGVFTDIAANLIGVYAGNAKWGDYDNDGDLDIALMGRDINDIYYTKIYNQKNGKFTDINAGIMNCSRGFLSWGDYDNDGDLDLAISGSTGSGLGNAKIYKNVNGIFTDIAAVLPQGYYSTLAWGDYDNDGDLDLFCSGYNYQTSVHYSKIYKNTSGTFTDINAGIPLSYYSSASWGDYDNDGDLDLLQAGYNGTTGNTKVYRNDGNNVFTEQNYNLTGTYLGTVIWNDFDNDGDLDILLAGYDGTKSVTKIYKNGIATTNSAPTAPASISGSIVNSSIVVKWNKGTDDHTPVKNLKYNLFIKELTSDSLYLPLYSDTTTGYVKSIGNFISDTFFIIKKLKIGKYRWGVQTIDGSNKGSSFTKGFFNITDTLQATGILFNNITAHTANITWQSGTGDSCVVFVHEGDAALTYPVNNTKYIANIAFASGTQLGSGWYCVYNGPNSSVTVNSLKTNTSYKVAVFEYLGTANNEKFVHKNASNFNSITTGYFEFLNASITGVAEGNVKWGDYDGDSDLDLLITGNYNFKIYRNDGAFVAVNPSPAIGINYSNAEWGDYDNDGDLDIVVCGYSGGNYYSKVYKNNGSNSFVDQTDIVLKGVLYGRSSFADINNDGLLDIFITGQESSGSNVATIYKNLGNNKFSTIQPNITGIINASIAWGDYDNDGDLDLLMAGNSGPVSKIYKNNGDFTFTELTTASLTGIYHGSVSWVDYDNDNDLDAFLSGYVNSTTRVTKLYQNNGSDSFAELTSTGLPGLGYASLSWGDFDNDGDLDLLLNGYNGTAGETKIYKNNGNSTFSEVSNVSLTGVYNSTSSWGDYDNDGDLDILISGKESPQNSTYITKIFRNDVMVANAIPTATALISNNVSEVNVQLNWAKASDAITPAKGLSYNVFVKPVGKTGFIVSPMADTTSGAYFLTQLGNAQKDTFFKVNKLARGTYRWGVQTIDASYKGSSFAKGYFSIVDTLQATNVLVSKISANTASVSWNRGTADSCVVFIHETDAALPYPVNNTKYIANTSFGSGTALGSGWYCAYNGPGTTVSFTNLKAKTNYKVAVFEYLGIANNEKFVRKNISNAATFTTGEFEPLTISLTGNNAGRSKWGDYDNDGDLDFMISGGNGTKIYRNDGSNVFTDVTPAALTSSGGTFAWGDYDNDGDLDVIKVNYNLTTLYKNNGSFSFEAQSSIDFAELNEPDVQWFDYDNDGYLDIYLMGYYNVTKIYRNNQAGGFVELTNVSLVGIEEGQSKWADFDKDGDLDLITTGHHNGWTMGSVIFYRNDSSTTLTNIGALNLTEVGTSSVDVGDYDNDGFSDILVSGRNYSAGTVSEVYKNNGNFTFTKQTSIVLAGVESSSAVWGDYDNDGYLDIMLSGTKSNIKSTKLYRNNGNNTFTETNNSFANVSSGDLSMGDYDNDGDLDVLLCGSYESSSISKVYENKLITSNAAPAAPTALNVTVSGSNAIYKWSPSSDDHTPSKGLSYNIYVKYVGKTGYAVSPMADTVSGKYFLTKMGNAQQDTFFVLKNLKAGKYTWGVQSIDGTFKGSAFAKSTVITIDTILPSNIKATKLTDYAYTVNFKKGSVENVAVFMAKGDVVLPALVDGTSYTANAAFGTGSQIGSTGWYCVYNSNGEAFKVTGIDTGTVYKIYAVGYFSSTGQPVYIKKTTADNPKLTAPIYYSPTVQAKNITLVSKGTSLEIRCTKGNGSRRIILVHEVTSNEPNFSNGTTFIANSTYGLGSRVESNWYCVYNGSDSVVNVTGVYSGNYIHARVYEYNGTSSNEVYNVTSSTTNPKSSSTGIYLSPTVQASNVTVEEKSNLTMAVKCNKGSATKRLIFVATGDAAITNKPISKTSYTASTTFGNGSTIDNWYCVYNGNDTTVTVTGLYENTRYKIAVYNFSGTSGNEEYNTSTTGTNVLYTDTLFKTPRATQKVSYIMLPDNAIKINCTKGNGNKRAIFIASGSTATFSAPVNKTTYLADTVFGKGSKLSTNWYCIYNGSDTVVTVTGLTVGNAYRIVSYEYFNTAGDEIYNKNNYNINVLSTSYLYFMPSIQTNNIAFSSVSGNKILMKKGSGQSRIVFAYEGDTTVVAPLANTIYNASNYFGLGSKIIGTNWYCVYNGSDSLFTLNYLKSGKQYKIAAFEYNGSWMEALNTSSAVNNPIMTSVIIEKPTIQTSISSVILTKDNKFKISLKKGDGSKRIVFARVNYGILYEPSSSNTYTADTIIGKGTQIGSTGWFCVYNGTDSIFDVSGIESGNKYYFHACEYNGTSGSEKYLTNFGLYNDFSTSTIYIRPSKQAKIISVAQVDDGLKIVCGKGNGSKREIFMNMDSTASAVCPFDSITYTSSMYYKSGTQIGTTGWYCVYSGYDSTTYAYSLTNGKKYKVAVFERNGDKALYNKTIDTQNTALSTKIILNPTVKASNIVVSNINGTYAKISWTNGDGENRLVFVSPINSTFPTLLDYVSFKADSNYLKGDMVIDYQCVYNGNHNNFTLSGLTKNTSYYITIVEYNGYAKSEKYGAACDRKTFRTVTIDGIDEPKNSFVEVYPNPASEFVLVSAPSDMKLEIFTLEGKSILRLSDRIKANENNKINLNGIAKGTYLLKFSNENETLYRKILVK